MNPVLLKKITINMRTPIQKIRFCCFVFSLFSGVFAHAQDGQNYLEKSIDAHQAFIEYVQSFQNPDFISKEIIENAKSRFDATIQYLDLTAKNGNATQIKAARYFKSMSAMRWARFLAFGKDKKAALAVIQPAMPDLETWKPQDFPLTYQKGEKVFVQKHEPFLEAQNLAFVNYAEWIFEVEKKEVDAKTYVQRALQSRWLNNWTRFAAQFFQTKIEHTSLEYPKVLSELLKQYKNLTNEEKNIVQKTGEGSPLYVARQFRLILEAQNNKKTSKVYPDFAASCATAAKELMKYSTEKVGDDVITQLFEYAVKGGFATDEALAFAKSKLYIQNIKKDILFPFDSVKFVEQSVLPLGRLVLEKKFPAVEQSADCSAKNTLAALYQTFKDVETAKKIFKLAKECEQKIAEEKRRDDAKFNFMFGVYPITLATTKFTNIGGHVDFRFKKNAHSFGYNIVKDKRDYGVLASNIEQKMNWSGFKMRYAFKHFSTQFSKIYWGGMFTYAQKESFTTENQTLAYMTATVTENNQRITAEFLPTEKQYEVMGIIGFQALKKLVATDFHIGLGGSFNQFDGGNARYWEKTGVTYSDNEFISKKRATVFYPQVRVAWSIGLNFGKPR